MVSSATPPPVSTSKPTLRQIAAKAGVSVVAVSCALRGNPGVSEATRTKVRAIAESIGYRPDPVLSQLMYHLRSRRRPKGLHNIAFIHWPKDRYGESILAGAREQADQHGYRMDVILMGGNSPSPRVLNRMLLARGIAGLVLGPSSVKDLDAMLDWNNFAVVLTGHSATAPNFHRVVPNQTSAIGTALDELIGRGCRRIGLVVPPWMEETVNSAHSAAFAWLAAQKKVEPLLCLYDPDQHPLANLSSWFRSNKPDALVLPSPLDHDTVICKAIGQEAANNLKIVALGYDTQRSGAVTVDYRPHTLGAIAVDQLVNQLHRNERGIPHIQQTLSVEGELVLTDSGGRK